MDWFPRCTDSFEKHLQDNSRNAPEPYSFRDDNSKENICFQER